MDGLCEKQLVITLGRRLAVQHGDECDSPLLQECEGPTNTEESDLTPSPENPGTPEPTADLSSNSGNYCLVERPEVKMEQEEHRNESFFSPPGTVKSEEEQSDTQIHETQMLSSNLSAAVSEETERGEQAITVKQRAKMMQGDGISDGKKAQAALSYKNCSVKRKKGRKFCHLCGKRFHYTASLMKHIKTHEKCTSCIICGMKYGFRSLQTHERKHTLTKEFVCQECGKPYRYKHCLITHMKSHSGDQNSYMT
uniref:C2H2-type domain-containing protein n=1 Tax=Pundamilia nyererei TaxID=303518 RepID=A0A3B4GLN6_9CICH